MLLRTPQRFLAANVMQHFMKNLAILLLITITFSSSSQEIGRKDTISRKGDEWIFDNIKKQEKFRKEKQFVEFQNSKFERFKGEILVVNEHTIKYDGKSLLITNTNSELIRVFEIGILYPSIFVENRETEPEKKDSLNSSKTNEDSVIVIKLSRKDNSKFFFNRSDSLTISDFKESRNYSNSPTKRKFDFLLFYKGFANPTEFSIELTNESATKKTDLKTFIDGASLTYIKRGSIQI